jgi:transcriptional regulator with XRE-family HTH domain
MNNSWIPGRAGTTAGGLIATARHRASMTQAELATAVNVTQTMISTYELGGREPSLSTLLKILKGTGCSLHLELTKYDDHDDVLNEAVERDPERQQQHLHSWEQRSAAHKIAQGHERTEP